MKTQKGWKREFNRLYSNLAELCRRVYAEDSYPRRACAKKFVDDLKKLVDNEQMLGLFTESIIIHILEMSKNLLRTDYIDTTYKSELRKHAQKLKSLRVNILEVANEVV